MEDEEEIVDADVEPGKDIETIDETRPEVVTEIAEGIVPVNGSVTTEKIADGAVTASKLDNGAVSTLSIRDHSVTDAKLDPTGVISRVAQLSQTVDSIDLTIDPDDLGLVQDAETLYVYPTYRGVRSANGIPLASSGGGGGGGGGGNAAVLTVANQSGWLSKVVNLGASCGIELSWSSLEDGMPTGDGSMAVSVNNVAKLVQTVSQGTVTIDAGPLLSVGMNKVKVRVADVYDNSRTITFSVSAVELSVASNFDTSIIYRAGTAIGYTYTPTGAVEKTVHFVIDGTDTGTDTVTESGRQQTHSLAGMSHGAHTILVYFTALVDGQTVRSNELYHSIVVVDPSSTTPIVSTPFRQSAATQYETVNIPYTVYNPAALTADVTLSVNGSTVSSLTVDRTQHVWSYRFDVTGTVTLTVATSGASKSMTVEVASSDIDVSGETANLTLHLTSRGRSNSEANPAVWRDTDNGISATMSGFNFVQNGWLADEDGYVALRVNGGARVTIPYKPFATDLRSIGKTIEVEFAVRNVLDYDAVVMSCMSGGRGFRLTSQFATLKSEQTEIVTQFKEEEHVRVSFVADKRTEDRLLYIYINGVASGVVRYPDNDDFSQQTPVGITIGSDYATVDVYCIRVYDNNLTRYQVLGNWIADTQNSTLMLERYQRNDVYDEYGNIIIEKLPTDLPYFILDADELPQYKGDKKTITGSYVDPQNAASSFTFTGCQINVQGTSSAPYARKNYDMQFKNGFEMVTGHAETYQLASSIKPNDRFVLKADVASSEGANNVELVKLFCDTDPYKRPEEAADSQVRKGIYGFPIVVFWHDTVNDTTTFLGKYNFNLPKRAPIPYGYSGDMESWEFQNNTSDLMLFKTDVFSGAIITDPTTGEGKAAWLYDYEARFPEDTWTNKAKLQELQSFVYSTYRANATGNALATPYTDVDGNTHTVDNAAYRLAKFRTEFKRYAEVDSFIFYYIFTELFLMVDSRAKNLFIGFSGGDATGTTAIDRKAVAEPYDMDTAIGTNNEGSLVFGYSLEDTDHLTGGANVFNGQDSVLWCNVRDAFPAEIVQMYQLLRSRGVLSYQTVMQRFSDHQAKWPEAIFNEDAKYKYIDPLTNPDPGKEPTAVYLPMMQGSKAEQRKWWLYNRFRYMDSKWNAGDALSDVIQLRGYAKADIAVTPYADVYPTVKYGSYLVSTRGAHGNTYTLACPLDSVNDTEIYVYSASQLASVGDLSGLKVGFADFSKATKLQSVKVGSDAAGYVNPNLTNLHVGENPFLRTVDARNCTALGGTVDLSGAANVEHAYFDGTAVTAVTLPVGGILKTLRLPATVTNLTVRDQPNIATFVMPSYANITTLRVEGCEDAIPYLTILRSMAPGSRVRIVGLEDEIASVAAFKSLVDLLSTFRGLDEHGNNVDTAQVSGTVVLHDTVTTGWIAKQNALYPYITIEADTVIEDSSSILDSWSDIITATENGTYSTKYAVGDTKELDLGTEGVVLMELVAFDADELASDATRPAATTWIAKATSLTSKYSDSEHGWDSTWERSALRAYLSDTVLPLVPSTVASAIKPVKKYTNCSYTSGSLDYTKLNYATTESLWVPSLREVCSGYTDNPRFIETVGVTYDDAFPDDSSRRRGNDWWLRTRTDYYPNSVNNSGRVTSSSVDNILKVILGFCI